MGHYEDQWMEIYGDIRILKQLTKNYARLYRAAVCVVSAPGVTSDQPFARIDAINALRKLLYTLESPQYEE